MESGLHSVGSYSQDYCGVFSAYFFNLAEEDNFAILGRESLYGLIQYFSQFGQFAILGRQRMTIDQRSRQDNSAFLILKGIERIAPSLAPNQPCLVGRNL